MLFQSLPGTPSCDVLWQRLGDLRGLCRRDLVYLSVAYGNDTCQGHISPTYSTHTHAVQAGKTAVGRDPLAVPCLGKIQRDASLVSKELEWPKPQDSRSLDNEDEVKSNQPFFGIQPS